jgi:hypothetical protein
VRINQADPAVPKHAARHDSRWGKRRRRRRHWMASHSHPTPPIQLKAHSSLRCIARSLCVPTPARRQRAAAKSVSPKPPQRSRSHHSRAAQLRLGGGFSAPGWFVLTLGSDLGISCNRSGIFRSIVALALLIKTLAVGHRCGNRRLRRVVDTISVIREVGRRSMNPLGIRDRAPMSGCATGKD